MRNPRGSGIKRVIFTVPELSRMAGISFFKMNKILAANKVPMHTNGKTRVVMLSSLEHAFPQLMDSVAFKEDIDE